MYPTTLCSLSGCGLNGSLSYSKTSTSPFALFELMRKLDDCRSLLLFLGRSIMKKFLWSKMIFALSLSWNPSVSQRPYVASIPAPALHVCLLLLSESSSALLSKDVKTLDNTGIDFSDVLFTYKYFLFLVQNALHLCTCRALKRW